MQLAPGLNAELRLVPTDQEAAGERQGLLLAAAPGALGVDVQDAQVVPPGLDVIRAKA
jgi:hypothetical protein